MPKYQLNQSRSGTGMNPDDDHNSSERSESPLVFHKLYNSSLIGIRDYQCRACRSDPEAEEHSDANNIVLMRHGAFSKHFGKRIVTVDVNQAVFFSKGSTYRVSHPGACGDRGTIFSLSQEVLNDIIREFDPTVDGRPEQPFPFVVGPCDSGVFLRQRDLVQRLEAAQLGVIERVQVDETALQLIATVLEGAFARIGVQRMGRRIGTDTDHADRVEAAKTYLVARLSERITLDGVSRAVYSSPFHLARLFQRYTGIPIHRYLIRLRLRTSLERLAEGEKDIAALALELGFSSHSHFTDAFRREFGFAPSAVRRNAVNRTFRKISKNLEV
jgi:AraC family transcriptional regulator